MTIAVIGASGRIGRRVVAGLAAGGRRPGLVAIGRTPARMPDLPPGVDRAFADCTDRAALSAALAGARIVVSCVHARFAGAVLAALPAGAGRVVLLGSTRCFTRFPDRAADEVRAAEAALRASPVPGLILHPTMIYGGDGENNVQRIAALIRRFGILALPDGGRSLLQPIHAADVAASVVAAAPLEGVRGAMVLAGPEAVTQAEFARAIARAIGRRVLILPAPMAVMRVAAAMTRAIPGLPRVEAAEILRLTEDKNFPIDDMTARLGIVPRPLAQGLRETFGPVPV